MKTQNQSVSHTPGPWAVEEGGGNLNIVGTGENSVTIAEMPTWACAHEEMEANARLIAAAPDLLAMLVKYVEQEEQAAPSSSSPMREAARAAIARATEGAR